MKTYIKKTIRIKDPDKNNLQKTPIMLQNRGQKSSLKSMASIKKSMASIKKSWVPIIRTNLQKNSYIFYCFRTMAEFSN